MKPTAAARFAPLCAPHFAPLLAPLLLCLGLLSESAGAADQPASSAGFSAGINVQPVASADDIGLPVYPGAKPTRDRDDDSPGANISLWGGAFGMRLQVLKLQAPDSVEMVSRYYREAMARYGQVLDCSNRVDPPAAEGDRSLRCDNDKPKRGERVFKVGTKKQMRIVSVEPGSGGSGALVQLVRLEFRRD